MHPESSLGDVYAQFEDIAQIMPSEILQVSVDIVHESEIALGFPLKYYIVDCLVVPAPELFAQLYGVVRELSSSVDIIVSIFDKADKEYFFGLGDVIRRIKLAVGAATSKF
jgi:hypothetical protein